MNDVDVTQEIYGFDCPRCSHAWEEEYEIRRCLDCEGAEMVTCLHHGVPVEAPWSGMVCPACGALAPRLAPQRHAARTMLPYDRTRT